MSGHGPFFYTHLCPCGWHHTPSFGDPWFSGNRYPVCPECGAHHRERKMTSGRMVKQLKTKWWHIAKWKFEAINESEQQQ